MKLRTGDKVMVITGKYKGTEGKITKVIKDTNKVIVDGVNVVKVHKKSTSADSVGGIMQVTKPIDASNVNIVSPSGKGKYSRIGYEIDAKGNKKRVFRQAGNKEIK